MKEGQAHWWRERVTAVALIPLVLWFLVSIVALGRGGYSALIRWLSMPSSALMMVSLLVIVFYHAALGMQVIIEDYVHSANKGRVLIIVRIGCLTLAGAGIVAVTRIVLHK
ncbi:succinate dehydrogenase, hydrophobic membrane anchor protein [Bradyrhizobium pachyrhizi]|uniref:Succinate dehydrogenase hydrophobic membrane anchor subunit n=1 Tax=Bradyrhizobium pachyrhizi TaxID=280333 RepID=A0A844SH41_9BRAD|nr:succinate dehydrogenase, hydrophobic membrane anchor protein [Bradyrhizobium pachyrhizi]